MIAMTISGSESFPFLFLCSLPLYPRLRQINGLWLREPVMLGIILILLLIWAGLVVLLWAGSVWFQGYIYSEPAPQLVWDALPKMAAPTARTGRSRPAIPIDCDQGLNEPAARE